MRRTTTIYGVLAAGIWVIGPGAGAVTAQTTRSVYISIFDANRQRVDGVTPEDLTLKEGGVEYPVTSVSYPTERMRLTILLEEPLAPIDTVRRGIFELAKRLTPQADIGLVVVRNRAVTIVEHTGDVNAIVEGLNSFTVRQMRSASNLVEGIQEVARQIERAAPRRPALIVVAIDTLQSSSVLADPVLDQIRKSRAVFHSVTVRGAVFLAPDQARAAAMLSEMAARGLVLGDGPRQSGGHRIDLRNTEGAEEALREIGDELSAQYLVTYALPEGVEPKSRLEVETALRGVELRAPTRIAD